MTYETLVVETVDGVMSVRMNRPDTLNALSTQMLSELAQTVAAAKDDPACRAYLLTGTGRGFCAGADLMEGAAKFATGEVDMSDQLRHYYDPVLKGLTTLDMPVIMAVNGVAAGAGANLALAGDIILAGQSASFTQVFARIGVVPDAGGTWHLPRHVGLAKAMGLAMLTDQISAEEAERLGMVWRVIGDDQLAEESHAIATRLAKGPTQALASIKQMLRTSYDHSFASQLDIEALHQSRASRSADFKEGVMAFVGKREAKFEGR